MVAEELERGEIFIRIPVRSCADHHGHGQGGYDRHWPERSKANRLDVSINGRTSSFLASQIHSISINGHAGDDSISFDELLEPVAIPSVIHGNGGADTIVGGSGRHHFWR